MEPDSCGSVRNKFAALNMRAKETDCKSVAAKIRDCCCRTAASNRGYCCKTAANAAAARTSGRCWNYWGDCCWSWAPRPDR